MSRLRLVLTVLVLSGALSALAQDTPDPAAGALPPNAPPPDAPPSGQEPEERPGPAPVDDVFIPTEELPVTEEVTFPVDI